MSSCGWSWVGRRLYLPLAARSGFPERVSTTDCWKWLMPIKPYIAPETPHGRDVLSSLVTMWWAPAGSTIAVRLFRGGPAPRHTPSDNWAAERIPNG
eukprot:11293000-Heterocapsa_arctica.AAC.1